MASSLFGLPAQPEASGAISTIELGEVLIRAAPAELRALGDHLLQAARELEAGASQVETFVFANPEVPRNTPLSVLIFGSKGSE